MLNTQMAVSRRDFVTGVMGVVVLALAFPDAASATSWGSATRISIGNVTYSVTSGVDEGLTATARVTATATTSVAAHSYAVRATLRNAIGGVVGSSGLVYNSSRSVSASCKATRPKGSYYAVGVLVANGAKRDAKPSPTCYNLPSPYSINEHGQTYGNLPDSVNDKAPDLIAAVGIGGHAGYLYFEAFDAAEEYDIVPVFAVDGRTVVDQFQFKNDQND